MQLNRLRSDQLLKLPDGLHHIHWRRYATRMTIHETCQRNAMNQRHAQNGQLEQIGRMKLGTSPTGTCGLSHDVPNTKTANLQREYMEK